MINYKSFANIWTLLLFYFRASFQGLLGHSFFRYRVNRYAIACLAIISYIFYFYINIIEFAKLGRVGQLYDFEDLKTIISLSVLSYNNLAIIVGLLIFLLAKGVLTLKRSCLFLAKTLSFEEKEVYWSVKLFKLGIVLLFFELFFIVLMPGLGVLQSPIIAITLFMSCHIWFLVAYLLADLFYKLSLTYSPLTEKTTGRIVSTAYFIGGLSYAFIFRFRVEFYLGRLVGNPIQLSCVILGFGIVLLLGLLACDKNRYDDVFLEQRFTGLLKSIYLRNSCHATLLGVIRTKLFFYSLIFLVFTILYSLMIGGTEVAGKNLVDLWPLLSVSFVHYADSTLEHRKLYGHLGLEYLEEVSDLFASLLIVQSPTLILGLWLNADLHPFLQSLLIGLISLLLGFLFPRSSSNLNEAIALILLLLAMIMLYLLGKIPLLLLPIIILSTATLIILIKKEREIR